MQNPQSETQNAESRTSLASQVDVRMPGVFRGLVSIAAAVIIFWGVRSLSFILAPLLMALVITIAIVPLTSRFVKRGMKSGMALIVTILIVLGAMAVTLFVVVGSLGKLSGLLPSYAADFSAQLLPLDTSSGVSTSAPMTTTVMTAAPTSATPISGTNALQQLLANIPNLQSAVSPAQVSGVSNAVVGALLQAAGQLLMVLFIFCFMLSAALSLRGRTFAGFGANSPAMKSFEDFTLEVRQYINLMTSVNFLVAAGDAVFLWVMGIPFALLWGFLAFLMGYIPVVGWWVSLIPPFFLAWAEFGIGRAMIVLVAYSLINGSVQNIFQPRIMGKGLHLSPLVVFVSVVVWPTVLGWMGALIAVPMTLIVLKLLDSSDSTRWMAAIMRFGTDGDEEESKQAVEKLRGVTGDWRDRLPFGSRKDTAAQDPVPARDGRNGKQ